VLSVPAFSQGAAFDNFGALWIMRSGSRLGELVRLDRRSGTVVARHAMPVGAEGISFAPDGLFWTLSEAGSQRWNDWPAFYPLAFRFDPKRLQ
jgi:streptogramin lyase